jgi:hypothetical protein
MIVVINHSLPVAVAKQEIEKKFLALLETYQDVVNDSYMTWVGNTCEFSFAAKGIKTSGSIKIEPSLCRVKVHVPFVLLPLSPRIKSLIEAEGKKVLQSQ